MIFWKRSRIWGLTHIKICKGHNDQGVITGGGDEPPRELQTDGKGGIKLRRLAENDVIYPGLNPARQRSGMRVKNGKKIDLARNIDSSAILR